MSDWYPDHEETKTMDLRWLIPFGHPDARVLQQKFVIRDGIGNAAQYRDEWREIDFVVSEI